MCENSKKKLGGGGRGVGWGQGGCEWRSEAFVKIQKKNWGGGGWVWGSDWGVSGWMGTENWSFYENSPPPPPQKKIFFFLGGGGRGRVGGRGVRSGVGVGEVG